MIVTLEMSDEETALLDRHATAQNKEFKQSLTGYDHALNQLTPVMGSYLTALRERYAPDDKAAVIAALEDPANVATAKAALGL